MTRWMKRILTGAVSAALTAALAVPALALDEAPEQSGSASVTLNVTDEAGQREDLAESQTTVDVYQVATVDENGVFTLTERFAKLSENAQWNEGRLGPETSMQDLQEAALAVLLAEVSAAADEPAIEAPGIEEDAGQADEAENEPELPAPDMQSVADVVGGQVPVGELGLYLLAPQDVETTSWDYTFSPVLLAVPSVDQESGQWVYDCAVTMKSMRISRLSGIIIQKTLQNYNATLGPTTFLFEVRAVKGGEVVYSNVAALTMSGPGTQSVTVEGIPAGADVTVTEVYSGASYTAVGGVVSVQVEDLPLPQDGGEYTRVPFTNDYTGLRVPDTSVTNTFVYNGTGWVWQSSQEAEG